MVSEQALRFLLEASGRDYRVYSLAELKLESCDACLGCLSTNRCVKPDGVNEIVDALTEASALVFAAPEYWNGLHGKARAFWERVCFMGRHNGQFPLRHLHGVIIGVSGGGDASAAIGDLRTFFEDALITVSDTVDVHGSYACFDCGLAPVCEVGGVWDIFPRATEILPGMVPGLDNQDPHLDRSMRRADVRTRLRSAAALP